MMAAKTTHAPEAIARAWIAGVLRGEPTALPLAEADHGAVVGVAAHEHVLALLEAGLRPTNQWMELPEPVRDAIARGARGAAMQSLFRQAEQQRIAAVLAEEGIPALLLKGNALALWLYPQPYMRATSDIDLLLESRQGALQAAHALSRLGYALAYAPAASSYEMTCRLADKGENPGEVDLHFSLVNSVLFADVFTFDELWRASFAPPGMPATMRALCLVHALANACLNRALDLHNGEPDRLKLLYDVHLMAARMGTSDWDSLIELARGKGIAGVCLRSIEDASRVLGSPVPPAVLQALDASAALEPLDRHRLEDWRYMQWRCFNAIPGWKLRARWLRDRLFPPRAHLQGLYGAELGLPLLLWRRVCQVGVKLRSRE